MLNKNDPLIGAVQEVMKRNQAEREAAKLVNEKFGVTDRKALPHERQGEWDTAYKTVLTEGVQSLNEAELSPKQKKLAATAGNKRKIDAPDLAHLRKHGGGHITEISKKLAGNYIKHASNDLADKTDPEHGYIMDKDEDQIEREAENRRKGIHRAVKKLTKEGTDGDTTSPSSMGIKKPDYAPAGTTPDYAKPKEQTVNRAAKTSLPPGTMKEEMTDAQMKKREEIVKSMKKKMAGFKERYGKRAKDVMYATATKQAMKEDNEGFNNRHGMSVTASAEKQAVADQLNERVVDNRQRKSRLAPVYTQGIKQTQARLAREPAEPPRSIGQKLRDVAGGAEAAITGAADRFTDFGQSAIGMRPFSDYARIAQDVTAGNVARLARGESPRGYSSSAAALDKYKRNLSQNYPTLTKAGQEAGDIASNASIVAGAPGLVKGGIKAGTKYLARKKADDVVQSTTKLLSAPKTAKPVSQAAREPASVAADAAKTVPQSAAASGTFLSRAKNLSKSSKQAQLARVGGSTVTANQSAIRTRLAQKAKDLRSGVATGAGKTVAAVKKYPGIPVGAAGGAAIIGGAALDNRPNSVAADNRKKGFQLTPRNAVNSGPGRMGSQTVTAPAKLDPNSRLAKQVGPSFEKTGRGAAPSAPAAAPIPKPKPQAPTPSAVAPEKKMTNFQRMTLQQQAKDVGPQSIRAQRQLNPQGVTTGKTIVQKPMAPNKNFPGK